MDSIGKSSNNNPMEVAKERIRTNEAEDMTVLETRANSRQEELKRKIDGIVDFVDNILQKIEKQQYGLK